MRHRSQQQRKTFRKSGGLLDVVGVFTASRELQVAIQEIFFKPTQHLRAELDYQKNIAAIEKGAAEAEARNATLGSLADAEKLGMLCPSGAVGGSYIGCQSGQPMKNPTDKHELIMGPTGSGKSTTLAMAKIVSLGMGANAESTVSLDLKGELCGSTAAGRAKLDGVDPILINPWAMYGLGSTRFNIFTDLVVRAKAGRPTKDAVLAKIAMVHPSPDSKGANSWIGSASMRLSSCLLGHLVECEPDRATPATMADIANFSQVEFAELMVVLKESTACEGWVAETAKKLLESYGAADDPKYFEWVLEDYGNVWSMYGKGSVLRGETSATEFDFTELKRQPRAVYILIPPCYLISHGKYVSLLFDALIDLIALARGNVRTAFILDEFVNIPKARSFVVALRLYRGYGIRMVMFVQDREGLGKYKDEGGHKLFDENCIGLSWGIKDITHARDIQERAGYHYVLVGGGINASVNERLNFGGYNGVRQREPILPADEVFRIADGKAILEMSGQKIFVLDRPFWKDLPFFRDYIRDLHENPLPEIDHL